MYYNPETKEIISQKDLKNKFNCSFPDGTEIVYDYFLIHDNYPQLKQNQYALKDEIKIIDKFYTQTYIIKENENTFIPTTNDTDLAKKVALLEKAVIDLGQMISNLEDYRKYYEQQKENENG